MFTSLHLENYKSFETLDLTIKQKQLPKKIVAIYGENGGGKSNIVSAFTQLRQSLTTRETQNRLTTLQAKISAEDDAQVKWQSMTSYIQYSQSMMSDLSEIFENTYRVGATAPMVMRYHFVVNHHSGWYELVFKLKHDRLYLAKETLYYLIKSANGVVFKIENDGTDKIQTHWSPSLFKGTMATTMREAILRFWGKHTFFSILDDVMRENNPQYSAETISANVIAVKMAFEGIAFKSDNLVGINQVAELIPGLAGGTLPNSDTTQKKLKATQTALNKYFVPLYSDIMQVFYQTKANGDNFTYQLCEKKRIGGETVEISFDLESHGTKQLLSLFPLFINAVLGKTVIIDEIDQGIHDLLVERVIDNLKEDITGQLIFTTHDTQIMKQLDPAALYVIQNDVAGHKKVVPLSKGGRTAIAANNNVQKMYLAGYFAGIPYADDVDFYDIVSELEED